MLKKTASILLGVLTLCTIAAPALAADDQPAAMPKEVVSKYVQVSGKVAAVDRTAGQVTIDRADGSGKFVLNVDDNTAIVNNETRKAMKLSGIKTGSTIFAWHSQAVTRSIPPQSYAYAITANVKENATVGLFFEAAGIRFGAKDVTMLNEAQDLYLTISKSPRIPVLNSGSRLKPSTLLPGERFFAWYDAVALSYPGRASTRTIVALPYAYDGSIVIQGKDVLVNGKPMYTVLTSNGAAMVPVAPVGKNLDFDVDVDSRTVTLASDGLTAVFTEGKKTFTLNGEEIGTAAPIYKRGALYVELDVFAHLGNYMLAEIVR